MNFRDLMDLSGIFTVQVVDGLPHTFSAAPTSRVPSDCSPAPGQPGGATVLRRHHGS
jgi:hypothetical protein